MVKTAFLNGKLKKEVYMEIPEACNYKSYMVCKLNKSLYGLKQAAKVWFDELDNVLHKIGFVNSEVDNCIYFHRRECLRGSLC